MKKVAFLFAGQGAQNVGMGKDLQEYKEVEDVYKMAEEITGMDIRKLSFEGPEEELKQTKNTQPAIVAMELAILEVLRKKGIKADMSAGLSLGEYPALVSGGALTSEEAMSIVKKRGEYMQDLCPKGEWSMAAILGLDDTQVEDVCKKVEKGFVAPANYNYPGQVAISGDKEGIAEAIQIAKEIGAKRAVELKTSGPFHTEKLKEASSALAEFIEDKEIKMPKEAVVIKNRDGKPYTEEDDIKKVLAEHVKNPTRMGDTIKYMLENNVRNFVEIGPGKTLSNFVTSIARIEGIKDAKVININDKESLEKAIKELESCKDVEL